MNPYAALADAVVVLHLAYVSYIVFGLLAILIGRLRRWNWVRNPWFRLTHVLAIVVVALEAVFDVRCPLTVWEHQLREAAGQPRPEGEFIGQIVHRLMFFDLPPWVFTSAYVSFALLVLATFLFVPVRFRRVAGAAPKS